jgi:signal transduction histidine kinase
VRRQFVKPAGSIFPPWVARAAPGVLATALGGLMALSRLAMQDVLGASAPFITTLFGIMVAAFLGGFWPAVLVTALGLAVAQWVLLTAGAPPLRPGAIAIFSVFGLLLASAGGLRQRMLRRARADAERLAKLQAQLVQVARLNAMGELAGALAHELNQPLSAIVNYLHAARQPADQKGPDAIGQEELLDRLSEQAERAVGIVGSLRAKVDRGEIEPSRQALFSLVREAVNIAVTGATAEVAVRYEFGPGTGLVLADRIQAQQVVLNLARNAIEAMVGSPRRELTVGSRLGADDFVETYVADTGQGLSPEVAERLFEPFVTDKPEGMGVGLSISRSIVEAHGGRIWTERNADGGATFRFTLPRAQPVQARAA